MRHPRAILALLLTCACGKEPDGPHVEQVLPARAPVGQVVNVLGEELCVEFQADGGTADCALTFVNIGPARALPETALDTPDRLRVVVPTISVGVTTLVVTVNGRQSNVVDFEVLAP